MHRLDALEHLAYDGRPRGVGETVRLVPLGQCCEPVPECVERELPGVGGQVARHLLCGRCVERELPGVGGQVARHLLCGRRQMTTPLDLEMAGRRGVSALGVGSGGGFQVLPNADHRLLQSPDGLGCNGPRASLAEKSGLGGIIQHYPA